MESPFQYGAVVGGKYYINREVEKQRIIQNLLSGTCTMVTTLRRSGKTSLMQDCITELNRSNQNVKTAYVDLFTISTEKEFFDILVKAVLQAISENAAYCAEFLMQHLEGIVAEVSKTTCSADFLVSIAQEDVDSKPAEILAFAEKVAVAHDVRLVICIDDFHNIGKFKSFSAFEKRLRISWQKQKHVSYCLFGSKPFLMKRIFTLPSKPYCRFGDFIRLLKIDTEEWVAYITSRFKSTGRFIPKNMAHKIAMLMDNHPWYVQQLAHYAWLNTDRELTQVELDEALNQVVNTNSPYYINLYEAICKTQINMLTAIYLGESQLNSKRVMDTYDMGTNRNITRNKQSLERMEIIEPIPDGFKFVDPVFAIWFGKRIVNI